MLLTVHFNNIHHPDAVSTTFL